MVGRATFHNTINADDPRRKNRSEASEPQGLPVARRCSLGANVAICFSIIVIVIVIIIIITTTTTTTTIIIVVVVVVVVTVMPPLRTPIVVVDVAISICIDAEGQAEAAGVPEVSAWEQELPWGHTWAALQLFQPARRLTLMPRAGTEAAKGQWLDGGVGLSIAEVRVHAVVPWECQR